MFKISTQTQFKETVITIDRGLHFTHWAAHFLYSLSYTAINRTTNTTL
jgi:hypothetical protein